MGNGRAEGDERSGPSDLGLTGFKAWFGFGLGRSELGKSNDRAGAARRAACGGRWRWRRGLLKDDEDFYVFVLRRATCVSWSRGMGLNWPGFNYVGPGWKISQSGIRSPSP